MAVNPVKLAELRSAVDGPNPTRRPGTRRQPAPEAATAPEFSDDELALEFVKQHGNEFRWTAGLDWMHQSGTHWQADKELRRYNAARLICREAAARADKDYDQRRLASAKTVAAVLTMAQSDRRIVLPADAWDADQMVLNTPGGVVDLKSGALRARRADEYFTQIARATPDRGVDCPTWRRFLDQVFMGEADVVAFLQRFGGYCLTGNRAEQILLFCHGVGANGKSTLLDLLTWLAGTYAIRLPSSALMQSHNDRHPTELAQLRGRRLAVSSELEEGQFWAESKIKELTGDETLTARYMRQDFFEFRQTQKHVIAGNYRPRLRGGDPALARRFVLLPFRATFAGAQRDPRMLDKLRAEAPGILAWLVDGAVQWATHGLQIPASIRAASADYMADHDDLALWMDERCERPAVGETASEAARDLYRSFADWKRDRGEHPPSETTWGQRMALVPGIEKRKSGGIKYAGVRLTADERLRLARGDRA